MDFIRSCTSNVHLLQNETSSEIRYDYFDLIATPTTGEVLQQHLDVVVQRAQSLGQLATVSRQDVARLWIFQPTGHSGETPQITGFDHVFSGAIQATDLVEFTRHGKSHTSPPEIALFLEAFSAYQTQLLKTIGTVHLFDALTWYITPLDDLVDDGDSDVKAISSQGLTVSLTFRATSAESVVIVTEVEQSCLRPLAAHTDIATGKIVVLAPLGLEGVISGIVPRLDNNDAANDAWQRLMDRYHYLRQIDMHDSDQDWVIIKLTSNILKDTPIPDPTLSAPLSLVWPVCLCFARVGAEQHARENECIPLNFEDLTEILDPIRQAEEWIHGTADREGSSRTVEASADPLLSEPLSDEIDEDDEFAVSPVYTRTLDAATTNGVYPTPPDGIVPTHNPPTSSTMNAEMLPEDDRLRRSSLDESSRKASVDMDGAGTDDDEDNLFGDVDVDEDLFENPDVDVTDADFSFFDDGAIRGMSRQISPTRPSYAETGHGEGVQGRSLQSTQHLESSTASNERPRNFSNDDEDVPMTNSTFGDAASSAINHDQIHHYTHIGNTTPPLSPVLVKERLSFINKTLSDNSMKKEPCLPQNNRTFAPVSFKSGLLSDLAKYKSGGRFSQPLKHERPETLLASAAKRSISLREYLGNANDHDTKNSRPAIARLGLRDVRIEDTDDSDTDSVFSLDLRTSPSSKRIAIDSNMPDTEHHDASSAERHTKLVKEPNVSPSALASLIDRIHGALTGPATMAAALPTLAAWGASVAATDLQIDEELWNLFDFEGSDYISVAQLVAANGISDWYTATTPIETDSQDSSAVFVRSRCLRMTTDITTVKTLTMSGFTALGANSAAINVDQASKTAPRPIARKAGTTAPGVNYSQHLFPLNAPYVRLRRGDSNWDVLSSALNLWETLGLEPGHGPKNVSAELITIGNDDLKDICDQFVQDVQYFYETCKFGTHSIGYRMHRKVRDPSDSPGKRPSREVLVLSSLKDACIELAKKLNHRHRLEGRTPVVVYLINPFRHARKVKYICACFQSCVHDLAPAAKDATLQIIPFEFVEQWQGAVVPRADQIIRLCKSLYDRVTPQKPAASQAPWKLFCAPSVSLVSPLPRKINFALNQTPPVNLMQEAQILHVAYAISHDVRWVNVAWTDYSGDYQTHRSYCLYKADREAIFAAIADTTAALIHPSATRRIVIACVGHSSAQERRLFSALSGPMVALAFVDVCLAPLVQLYPQSLDPEPHAPAPSTPALAQAATSLTPASTPQAASTVSPEAHRPPTPSSTEHIALTQPQSTDSCAPDPDATLVDSRDESFALVLPFPTSRGPQSSSFPPPQKRVLASGQLLKRGDAVPNRPLPSLGVDVVQVIPPKLAPGQSNWMMARTPEYILREVLAWYRGLGLLGKIRGVRGCERGERPWHIGVVVCSCEALAGFHES